MLVGTPTRSRSSSCMETTSTSLPSSGAPSPSRSSPTRFAQPSRLPTSFRRRLRRALKPPLDDVEEKEQSREAVCLATLVAVAAARRRSDRHVRRGGHVRGIRHLDDIDDILEGSRVGSCVVPVSYNN